MTTDLSNKTVEELFEWAYWENYDSAKDNDNGYRDVASEFSRRLEEAQQKNADRDAKVAAEAKAEALEELREEISDQQDKGQTRYINIWITNRITQKAAEYRAKAKGDKNATV